MLSDGAACRQLASMYACMTWEDVPACLPWVQSTQALHAGHASLCASGPDKLPASAWLSCQPSAVISHEHTPRRHPQHYRTLHQQKTTMQTRPAHASTAPLSRACSAAAALQQARPHIAPKALAQGLHHVGHPQHIRRHQLCAGRGLRMGRQAGGRL